MHATTVSALATVVTPLWPPVATNVLPIAALPGNERNSFMLVEKIAQVSVAGS